MKGLVIAAGLGSRLRSVSESKPLIPVAKVPLIERVVAGAAAAGIGEFIVVTGHAAQPLEQFLAGLSTRLGVAIRCVRIADWERPNGHSVVAGAEAVGGDFLLMMADHLFDPAIAAQLLAVGRRDGVTLAVDRDVGGAHVDLADATKVEVAPDGRIAAIGKNLTSFNAIDTGLFRAAPALAAAIRAEVAEGGDGSLTAGVRRLAVGGQADTLDVTGLGWIDIDDPRALARAEAMLDERGLGRVRDNAA